MMPDPHAQSCCALPPPENATRNSADVFCNKACTPTATTRLKALANNVLERNSIRNNGATAALHGALQPAIPDKTQGVDALIERAAIIEANGVPRAWAEGLAGLNPNVPPTGISASRWLLFIDDCGRFLDQGWAARACQFGWGPLDLFGCDSMAPVVRTDHQGLLWLMEGRKLIDLNRNAAIIECRRGIRQTYRRHPAEASRVVTAWELERT